MSDRNFICTNFLQKPLSCQCRGQESRSRHLGCANKATKQSQHAGPNPAHWIFYLTTGEGKNPFDSCISGWETAAVKEIGYFGYWKDWTDMENCNVLSKEPHNHFLITWQNKDVVENWHLWFTFQLFSLHSASMLHLDPTSLDHQLQDH